MLLVKQKRLFAAPFRMGRSSEGAGEGAAQQVEKEDGGEF